VGKVYVKVQKINQLMDLKLKVVQSYQIHILLFPLEKILENVIIYIPNALVMGILEKSG
jgi:hypothetical protein